MRLTQSGLLRGLIRIELIMRSWCSHFLMTFDTSPVQLKKVDEALKRDPAVVR